MAGIHAILALARDKAKILEWIPTYTRLDAHQTSCTLFFFLRKNNTTLCKSKGALVDSPIGAMTSGSIDSQVNRDASRTASRQTVSHALEYWWNDRLVCPARPADADWLTIE